MSYGRGPPDIRGMVSLKVDNLTYRTTPEDLKRAFEKYGDVGDVYIPRDRFSRESRGFAFVRFFHNRDAEDAMESMDGAIVDGREMRVQLAKYGRPSEPPRRGPPRRRGSDRGDLDHVHEGGTDLALAIVEAVVAVELHTAAVAAGVPAVVQSPLTVVPAVALVLDQCTPRVAPSHP